MFFLFSSAGSTCVVFRGDNDVSILVDSVSSSGPSCVVVDGQAYYLIQRVQIAIRETGVLGILLRALLGRKPSEEGVHCKGAFGTDRAQCAVDAFIATYV